MGSLAVYWTPKIILKGTDSVFGFGALKWKLCIAVPMGLVRDGSQENTDLLLQGLRRIDRVVINIPLLTESAAIFTKALEFAVPGVPAFIGLGLYMAC